MAHPPLDLNGSSALEENARGITALKDLLGSGLGPLGGYKLMDNSKSVVLKDGYPFMQHLDIVHPGAIIAFHTTASAWSMFHDGSKRTIIYLASILERIRTLIHSGVKQGLAASTLLTIPEAIKDVMDRVRIVEDINNTTANRILDATVSYMGDYLPARYSSIIFDLYSDIRDSMDGGFVSTMEQRMYVEFFPGFRGGMEVVDGIIIPLKDFKSTRPVKEICSPDTKIALLKEGRNISWDYDITLSSLSHLKEMSPAARTARALKESGVGLVFTDLKKDLAHFKDVMRANGIDVVYNISPDYLSRLFETLSTWVCVGDSDVGERVYSADMDYMDVGGQRALILRPHKQKYRPMTAVLRSPHGYISGALKEGIRKGLLALNAAEINNKFHLMPGGGALEIILASALAEMASESATRESLVLHSISWAFEDYVRALARNSGYKERDAVREMRSLFAQGYTPWLHVHSRVVSTDPPVYEPYVVDAYILLTVVEVAYSLTRIDQYIASKTHRQIRGQDEVNRTWGVEDGMDDYEYIKRNM